MVTQTYQGITFQHPKEWTVEKPAEGLIVKAPAAEGDWHYIFVEVCGRHSV